jgi:hypothetical protein
LRKQQEKQSESTNRVLLEALQISVYFFAISRRPEDLQGLILLAASAARNGER